MMKKIWTTAILTIVLCTVSLIPTLQAQSSQDTLTQYISNLQKNPNDYALREKIIKHVQGMRQKPAIPEEARKHFIKAVTMQKEAKHAKDGALSAAVRSNKNAEIGEILQFGILKSLEVL